jgi:multidrug transporter EmrE-like cation transporter
LGFIITALLGILLLGERVTIRKVVGLFSAFATLVVLAKS